MTTEKNTCEYFVTKDVLLDLYIERTAVGIFPGDVWTCPHEQLEGDERDYCAFHTIPENVPNGVDEAELFIKTINEASDVNDDHIARYKKEFIGATFGRFDLPEETCLNASDDHPIRLSHASFTDGLTADEITIKQPIKAEETRFVARDDHPVSFKHTKFKGNGDVSFQGARFRGKGDVLFQDIDLSGANLRDADFSEIDLQHTKLIKTDLRGTNLSGSDLRETEISDNRMDGSTKCGRLELAEDNASESDDWDAIARSYHSLKSQFSKHGLVGKARQHHVLEREARGNEARHSGNYSEVAGSLASRYLTGYGIDYKKILTVMAFVFIISTLIYGYYDVEDFVLYSVITFTTAPPYSPPPGIPELFVMAETFFGTLLIVLLGYVLGNRESF